VCVDTRRNTHFSEANLSNVGKSASLSAQRHTRVLTQHSKHSPHLCRSLSLTHTLSRRERVGAFFGTAFSRSLSVSKSGSNLCPLSFQSDQITRFNRSLKERRRQRRRRRNDKTKKADGSRLNLSPERRRLRVTRCFRQKVAQIFAKMAQELADNVDALGRSHQPF